MVGLVKAQKITVQLGNNFRNLLKRISKLRKQLRG
jgi:hypothetical protein